MPSQEQIDQEAGGNDLEQRVAVLEDTIATLRRNLLEPAMTRPGLLRFGRNVMQLDNNGGQVQGATTVPPATAIWFTKELTPTPSTSYPRGQLDGYAIPSPAAGLTEIQALASSTYYAKVYAYTGTATNPETGMYLTDGTNTSTAILVVSASAVNGRFTLDNATLRLASFTSDPTTVADGDVWYRSDTDVIRARINGATVNIATGTVGVATDAIWDAKGDLAVGTGADTAVKLAVGSNGRFLRARSTASQGISWQQANGNIATQTSGSLSAGESNDTILCDASSGNVTINLPSAGTENGMTFRIKRIDTSANTVTIDASGSETIDGALTITLAPWQSVTLVNNASAWYVT